MTIGSIENHPLGKGDPMNVRLLPIRLGSSGPLRKSELQKHGGKDRSFSMNRAAV